MNRKIQKICVRKSLKQTKQVSENHGLHYLKLLSHPQEFDMTIIQVVELTHSLKLYLLQLQGLHNLLMFLKLMKIQYNRTLPSLQMHPPSQILKIHHSEGINSVYSTTKEQMPLCWSETRCTLIAILLYNLIKIHMINPHTKQPQKVTEIQHSIQNTIENFNFPKACKNIS